MKWTDGAQMERMMTRGIYSLYSWPLFSQFAAIGLNIKFLKAFDQLVLTE